MPLKSTNIWDDIREEDDSKGDSSRSHRGWRASVRSGASPQTTNRNTSEQSGLSSSHANRHGVSMKSLFKNR